MNLKARAKALKQEITAIYYAYKQGQVPWYVKGLIWLTIGYAISPIDLIPDFIPVLGYLDDVILLPALIALCIRCIPKAIMAEARLEAQAHPIRIPKNIYVTAAIIIIWLVVIYGLAGWIFG